MKKKFLCFLMFSLFSFYAYSENEFEKFENAEIPVRYENVRVVLNTHFSNSNYDISADSVDELGEQLIENAPVSSQDVRSISMLRLDVNWNIKTKQNPNFCDFRGVDINSDVDFVLPNWLIGERISDVHADKWYNFLDAIAVYQEQNKRIINKHLEVLKDNFEKIEPAHLCSEIESKINEIGNKELVAISREIGVLAYETQNGSIVKNLTYPDFSLKGVDDLSSKAN